MTEETPPQESAPGAAAGDAAPTQEIPLISKMAEKAAVKRALFKKPAVNNVTSAKTDKGREREPLKSANDETGAVTDVEGSTKAAEKRLTAAEYARTTKSSPASTAVIPAVKDAPADDAVRSEARAETQAAGRRAILQLNHIEPWSVTRIAFAVSVAMMVVGVVAVTIFWIVLSITGVWGQINDSITSVLSDNSSTFNITDYFGFWRLVGLTLVLSAINVVLMTALATIAAHLYNLAAQLLGGVEVTFGEDS